MSVSLQGFGLGARVEHYADLALAADESWPNRPDWLEFISENYMVGGGAPLHHLERLRERYPAIPPTIDTVVYIDGGRAHVRSKAFLHLARHLRAPWRWAYAVRWLPALVLDLGYRVIAALRYRLFGTVDACELPSPANRARFLP